MGYDFELSNLASVVHPIHDSRNFSLSIDGRSVCATLISRGNEAEFILEIDGHREPVFTASLGDIHYLHIRGRTHRVEAINALERAQREASPSSGTEILRAPMPGVVVDVAVEEGVEVEPGQLLMTIESMKLQTAIVAPHAARVAEVCLSAGASFDHGAALVRLEAHVEEEGEEK
jgi:3-methylcrotonyl-CoA carboxylase alpha subunit